MESRIVITGCGSVTPAGLGVEALWRGILKAQPFAKPLTDPRYAGLPSPQAGVVPPAVEAAIARVANDDPSLARSRCAAMMAVACAEAIGQAGWTREILSDAATGTAAATSKGDLHRLFDGEPGGLSLAWPSAPGTLLRRRLGIGGPAVNSVAACATGTHALIRAAQMIRDGQVSRALVTVADASVMPLLLGAFASMGVLTADRCRPFDRRRDGFVLAEGAVAVTIERADVAVGRPLVELSAWLIGADPTGLTAQDPQGRTLARLLSALLSRAAWRPEHVDLYCAHGTGTPSNDRQESAAVAAAFAGADPRVTAAKSVVGHLLGAAGLTEAIVAIQSLRHGIHPPTASTTEQADDDCRVRLTDRPMPADLRSALCTSMGFGGQIGLLALQRMA
ncbi:MAG: 3-oxoacyl-[acyl-carrier-protein] synthase 2 [Phycisphaerae bacterium]|nr:3-oxoacyl-[acyl-carrier-protein] synthase 2 [Phycisphaerae bacterium]